MSWFASCDGTNQHLHLFVQSFTPRKCFVNELKKLPFVLKQKLRNGHEKRQRSLQFDRLKNSEYALKKKKKGAKQKLRNGFTKTQLKPCELLRTNYKLQMKEI
mmetsp:Transcript_145178/g.205494  ORF Transcript_145178/g.205494 Transcript_145178/m.205494 type:complete len:103 (-) Transcript_145178:226-534(-)